MRVLLTEGNGLTSRQVATHLDRLGHHVEVLTSERWCLARFTKHVRRLHTAPRYADDPHAWLRRALSVHRAGSFDLLFPTHEQSIVMAHQQHRLEARGVTTAVAPFESYARVFDKVSAHDTLTDLRIGQPRTVVVRDAGELRACPRFPVFVKLAVGNSSTGVTRVDTAEEMHALASTLRAAGAFRDGVVVQQPAEGPFVMVQAVFADGELVAFHTNLRVREGADGSAAIKRSARFPVIREQMETLGRELSWHGALSADVIVEHNKPRWIDINPRLVEPGNAYRSGVDLVAAYVEVARGTGVGAARSAAGSAEAMPGRDTHQLLMALLGSAQQGASRQAIAADLVAAVRHTGPYGASVEELLPARGDARTALLPIAAAAAVLARPSAYRAFTSGAATNYALGEHGWRELRESWDRRADTTHR
jgi:glutathione synthase/RimK-type ligase-like ATP-grasp enzyme